MGHYAVDFQCDTCGKLRCVCPPKKEKPNTNWIVKGDFSVQRICDFDADPENNTIRMKYGSIPWNPIMNRMGAKEFKKREDAELHARELCEAAVEAARLELAAIKKVCKVTRPWEKK